jgi:hypothetical protein
MIEQQQPSMTHLLISFKDPHPPYICALLLVLEFPLLAQYIPRLPITNRDPPHRSVRTLPNLLAHQCPSAPHLAVSLILELSRNLCTLSRRLLYLVNCLMILQLVVQEDFV